MLGELLSRILLLLFGYAMPAFECFKTVEARPNDARMLRFWCQYWIIVAMVSILLFLHSAVVVTSVHD